ncbi:MAG: sugar ABC transporter substrate-binding protein [Oscillibacter sp.]|nr:sugar ABC transporter substrate-binding protein [Oscillibacter sp.]
MKKFFALVLALIMALSMVACGAKEEPAPEKEEAPKQEAEAPAVEEKETYKIGVTSMTLKEAVYMFVCDAMKARAAELGNVEVEWVACENDAAVQMQQVEAYIQQGVDLIVIEPARSDACVNIISACNDAGIPVINLNAQIRGINVPYRSDSNSYQVGQMQVEKFAEVFGTDEKAKVAVIGGSLGDECAETITQAAEETIAKYSNMENVLTQMHQNWDRQLAMQTMEALLVQHPDIKAVFCNNDTMAHGCYKAAQNVGKENDIYFFGADWDQDSAELILSGVENFMVVNKGAIEQGIVTVDMAMQIIKGEEVEYDEVLTTDDGEVMIKYSPMVLVTKDNIEEQVALKYPDLLK